MSHSVSGNFYKDNGMPSDDMLPADLIVLVTGMYQPSMDLASVESQDVPKPYPVHERSGLFWPAQLDGNDIEQWDMNEAEDAYGQTYRPKTVDDVRAGLLSVLCCSLEQAGTKAMQQTYASRARAAKDKLYGDEGLSFEDWDKVLLGRVGWEMLVWAHIFDMATEEVVLKCHARA
jgi:hypothetical protein